MSQDSRDINSFAKLLNESVLVCSAFFQACFEDLVQFMSSGPSHILVLSQIEGTANIIPAWREFIGPADIEEARRENPERLVERNSKCCTFEEKEQGTKQLNLSLW